jgi:lipoprotein-anchoring transpeptidase ErfK/SrfK
MNARERPFDIPKKWRSTNQMIRMVQTTLLLFVLLAGCWLAAPVSLRAQDAAIFFPSTGQRLDDSYGFLSYWRSHHGDELFGAAITGIVEENGLMTQYFERGRLEYHPELAGSPVLPGRVGSDYAAALWRVFDPPLPHHPAPDVYIFEATGYALREPFLSFWQTNGGLGTFGYPISEPIWEYVDTHMILVQYFERGRLERHPGAGGAPDDVLITPLGYDLALLRGYEVNSPRPGSASGLSIGGLFPFEPTPTPSPTPLPLPTATPVVEQQPAAAAPSAQRSHGGQKYMFVNLSHQWLYAYDGETLVFDAPVSTGKDGFNTPVGNFAIYAKVPLQTMSGTIGGEYYSVPNVPHAMYITGDVAMHGTYWHNQFGSGVRMSHGCINLPPGSAAWIYKWAPVGTPVEVGY